MITTMDRIRELPIEQIIYGIDRCKARLSGVMPMGMMTAVKTKEALKDYQLELQRRGQNELNFE